MSVSLDTKSPVDDVKVDVKSLAVSSAGKELTITDVNNLPVPVSNLWNNSNDLTIVVFVRHFMWEQCQEYWRSLWKAFSASQKVIEKKIGLTLVGCGTPKLGISIGREIGSFPFTSTSSPTPHQSLFNLYFDPTRVAYTSLGLKYKTYFSCGMCLAGTWRALYQGITKCWCMCSSGDVQQQGGVFILDNEGECRYSYKEDIPTDHVKPEVLLKEAGAGEDK